MGFIILKKFMSSYIIYTIIFTKCMYGYVSSEYICVCIYITQYVYTDILEKYQNSYLFLVLKLLVFLSFLLFFFMFLCFLTFFNVHSEELEHSSKNETQV